ncbi:MAG: DUF167 family protein [Acidimicrobiales bacterium]
MDVDELFTAAADDAVVLRVHVQPGAGRTAVVGRHGTALKVRVAAPPEGGRANAACAALLAETFSAAATELVGGERSQEKRFKLTGLEPQEFRRRLERAVEEGTGRTGPDARPQGRR